MIPYDYRTFIDNAILAVECGDITMDRVDDAVRRILRVKLKLGLFEQALRDLIQVAQLAARQHGRPFANVLDLMGNPDDENSDDLPPVRTEKTT